MVEGSYDVFYFFGVAQRIVFQEPVVDDEGQVVSDFYLLSDFVTIAESVSHDSDEHVEQVNEHDELGTDEKGGQVAVLAFVT